MNRAMTCVAALLLLGACTSGSPSPSAGPTSAGASAGAAVSSPVAELPLCEDQPNAGDQDWRCGTLDVPLDREDPSGTQISIAYYVLPHTDLSSPASEPFFATPGGPGADAFDNFGLYPTQDVLLPHHDFVTVDPRGSGRSGTIDCPDLQNGFATMDEMQAAVAACGKQLGHAADRYGSADVAMDVDAVRAGLGFDQIDYYAPSYGAITAQAYAVRFPEHLHALILDSGGPAMELGPGHAVWFGTNFIPDTIAVPARGCLRDPVCVSENPHPAAALEELVRRIGTAPVEGRGTDGDGNHVHVHIDQSSLIYVLSADPVSLITAVDALRRGDSGPLLDLGADYPPFVPSVGDPATIFSWGENIAVGCTDQAALAPWAPADPIPVRQRKLAAALTALPDDAFAPYSKEAWSEYYWFESCIPWPAPDRLVPPVPKGAEFPDVPTLLLSGDADSQVPTQVNRLLLQEFPNATFVVVAGAGHPTLSSETCAPTIAATFLDTLDVGDTSCAKSPS